MMKRKKVLIIGLCIVLAVGIGTGVLAVKHFGTGSPVSVGIATPLG